MGNKVIFFSILTIFFSIILFNFVSKFKAKHPFVGLNVQQIIQEYEYPVEVHDVTTEDGYILTLHRIPHGNKKIPGKRIPILLVPGILQSAWDFVHYGPNHSLAFILTEKGYDVWLGNVRGVTWSRKHKTLDPDKDSSFWDFTVNEIGIYDLPAFVDYILEDTKEKSLLYVGFSQGTIAFFIMASEKSDYLSKIKFMTAMSPAIFMKNPKSPLLRLIANNLKLVQALFNFFNYQELFRRGGLITTYLEFICSDDNSVFIHLCIHHNFFMFGYSYDELNKSMLPLTFSHSPSGGSLKQILHLFQMMHTGDFRKYDFGSEGNLERYGQDQPPHYNLSKVTTPVALYYSEGDWAVDITNADRVLEMVPNVVKNYKVPSEHFNHLDFLSSKNVVNLLYNAVIDELSKH